MDHAAFAHLRPNSKVRQVRWSGSDCLDDVRWTRGAPAAGLDDCLQTSEFGNLTAGAIQE